MGRLFAICFRGKNKRVVWSMAFKFAKREE
jgi:hypothetical protein